MELFLFHLHIEIRTVLKRALKRCLMCLILMNNEYEDGMKNIWFYTDQIMSDPLI